MEQIKPDPNEAWSRFLENCKEGDVVAGMTTRLATGADRYDAVAYLDLDGVEGTLHAQDAVWSRGPRLPSPGDRVYCRIICINPDHKTVELGGPIWNWEQWLSAVDRLTVGSCHRGKVLHLTSDCAFIEIGPGVYGHILPTELQKLDTASREQLNEGDEVDVVVLSLRKSSQELLLGLKLESANSVP